MNGWRKSTATTSRFQPLLKIKKAGGFLPAGLFLTLQDPRKADAGAPPVSGSANYVRMGTGCHKVAGHIAPAARP